MNKSENIKELATALAKAQGQIESAKKDSENPFFKNKYADLSSVWDACRKQLSDNGLSVVQTLQPSERVTVVTTLLHSSGQWISGELTMTPNKSDPQGIGSCLTYNRRYSLSAIVGICPDDDDGNEASKDKPEQESADREKISTTAPGLTLIKSITFKTGKKKNGSEWTRYKITDGNGVEYSTFSKTQADIAKIARDKKAECLITYNVDGNYKNIELIEMQDPNSPAPEDIADEDIADEEIPF